ncbi:MAG: peptide chain release factor N(5)-glutamine methyltransferase [Desulfobacterales bacterium]|jgi:release factor glutamine methyltransferase
MPTREWTISSLLIWTAGYLKKKDIDSPRITAEILLADVLGLERIDLYLRYDQPMNVDELARFKEAVQRRVAGEPVAYITGVKEFWSLELLVGPGVLIPRVETECLVEAALGLMDSMASDRPLRLLDLGCGSGAISLAIAKERPRDWIVASDLSLDALTIARENIKRLGMTDRVLTVASNWLSAIDCRQRPFDLIISNPPYVDSQDFPNLQIEVRDYEPRLALDGLPGGLESLRRIIQDAHRFLKAGGYLVLEIGYDQKARVKTLFSHLPDAYSEPVFGKDYGGRDRLAIARVMG